jgi:hypothetical protein
LPHIYIIPPDDGLLTRPKLCIELVRCMFLLQPMLHLTLQLFVRSDKTAEYEASRNYVRNSVHILLREEMKNVGAFVFSTTANRFLK